MIKIIPSIIIRILKATHRKLKPYSNDGFPYGRTLVIEIIVRDNNFKKVVELGVFNTKNFFILPKKILTLNLLA